MLEKNEIIELSGGEGVFIVREIAYILISLNKIAEYYYNNDGYSQSVKQMELEYSLETTNFIDRNKVTRRLSKIKRIISEKFDSELGSDELDDIEREVSLLKYWEKPGD